ncbi:MAG TPA: Slp family lipoprotein [Nitrospiraceae bacterium]|nr:Slp family lipoprotein [Nitrospiraceae bacterium]
MRDRFAWPVLWLLLPALLSGCASTAPEPYSDQAERVSFTEIKASPESHKGRVVVLGGEVLAAKRLKEGTRIEVLQLPLNGSNEPGTDLTKSQGRFVAIQRDFLDPATVPPGTRVTITGEVTGSITLPLDETEYTYPVLEIKNLKVWPRTVDGPLRIRPPYGPYWGPPYWGPYYWGRYPY